mmetsp:Transcript_39898/g.78911  ORF Transcript_39898/g.78911 Transcript_39898/m.78911 type:complete len:268 (-) Transcript_39898:994-1797(-)
MVCNIFGLRELTCELGKLIEASPRGDLLPVLLQNVVHPGTSRHQLIQEGRKAEECCVMWIIVPGADKDTIVWLEHEIFLHIVDDECLFQLPAKPAQVLHENRTPRQSMLPVQSVSDQPRWVNLVNDPVCIVLGGSGENDNFIAKLIHSYQEIMHPWPDVVAPHAIQLEVVHQCFIKVQDQRVGVRRVHWRKFWVLFEIWQHGGQRLEPDRGSILRKCVSSITFKRIFLGQRGVRISSVNIQQRAEAHVLQHLSSNGASLQTVQRHAV